METRYKNVHTASKEGSDQNIAECTLDSDIFA